MIILGKFFHHQKGSVTIEFTFMVILLCMMFAFMADLAIMRSTIGKLDRTSYSLVNIVKERTQFYEGRDTLDQSQVDKMQRLAAIMLNSDPNNVGVVIEYMSFATPERPQNGRKPRANSPTILRAGYRKNCEPIKPISDLPMLSPVSENGVESRYVPLYQVTVCMPNYSLFQAILGSFYNERNQLKGTLRSSSIGVRR